MDSAVLTRAIAEALLHSLWQCTIIGAAAAGALHAARAVSPRVRYAVCAVALAGCVGSWVTTAVVAERAVNASLNGRVRRLSPLLGPADPTDRSPAIRPLSVVRESTSPPMHTWAWPQQLRRWAIALVPLWGLGVCLLLGRLVFGLIAVERLRRMTACVRADVSTRALRLARAFGLSRCVIRQSPQVQVPIALGVLRPQIILPAAALAGWPPAQVDALIAHELAHIQRADYLWNVLQHLAEAMLFYHPVCWWLSRQTRLAREQCCDDAAIAVCGDPLSYVAALAALVDRPPAAATAVSASYGSLLARMQRIVTPGSTGPARGPLALPGVVLAIGAVVGALFVGPLNDARAGQAATSFAPRPIPSDRGLITGRVVDEGSGQPIAGATVETQTGGHTLTDADGAFVLSGVRVGPQLVFAAAPGYVADDWGGNDAPYARGGRVEVTGGQATTGIEIRLRRAGRLNGRVLSPDGRGLSGIEVDLVVATDLGGSTDPRGVAFAQTGDGGTFTVGDIEPGVYRVRAYRHAKTVPEGTHTATSVQTYFPNALTFDDAQPVYIGSGQELFDLEVVLQSAPGHRIAGRLTDVTGEPVAGATVVLWDVGGTNDEYAGSVRANGAFEIRDVPAGDYVLLTRDEAPTLRWVSATQRISVDRDIEDLDLYARPSVEIEGNVRRDSQSIATPLDPTGMSVRFGLSFDGVTMQMGRSSMRTDGGFTAEAPGAPVLIRIEGVPRGWMVQRVSVDGHDVTDTTIDLGAGRRQVEVVLTDRVTAISGVAVDRRGTPLPAYSVVAFSSDPQQWTEGSRQVQEVRTNNLGQFSLEALPPGEYCVVAVQGLPPSAVRRVSVLKQLRPLAETLLLRTGDQKSIAIRASVNPLTGLR